MYEEDIDTDETDEQEDDNPRGLRRAANKSKKLEQENNLLKRELAFAKAGLPMDDPRMNYFIKGYEGDLVTDAIRKTAIEAGFLQVQQQSQEQQANPSSAAQQRVMEASAGAITEGNSQEAAFSRMEAAMAEGGVEAMLDVARQYGIPTSYDS